MFQVSTDLEDAVFSLLWVRDDYKRIFIYGGEATCWFKKRTQFVFVFKEEEKTKYSDKNFT